MASLVFTQPLSSNSTMLGTKTPFYQTPKSKPDLLAGLPCKPKAQNWQTNKHSEVFIPDFQERSRSTALHHHHFRLPFPPSVATIMNSDWADSGGGDHLRARSFEWAEW